MEILKEPFVSVVTPVYNGEKYLGECIESVLKQTYKNWEYIILNNCSTDRTLEIAKKYKKKDSRIKIYSNDNLLPIIQNWNHALRKISKNSRYCKIVHADDWLFPQCIEQMVGVAERYPSVGITGSYGLKGNDVVSDRIPFPDECIPGRQVCRLALKMITWPFPRPTALLIRSDLIRKKFAFYNEPNLQADHEACYDILKECDFGFVHQVLTFMRVHDSSVSLSNYEVYGKLHYTNMALLKKYGPIFLNNDEYAKILKDRMYSYKQFLTFSLINVRDEKFWDYHKASLKDLGYKYDENKLYLRIINNLINEPRKTLSIIWDSFKKKAKNKEFKL